MGCSGNGEGLYHEGCGLVPLLIAALVSYLSASRGMTQIENHASTDLKKPVPT